MQDFLRFLGGQKLQKVSIRIEESNKEIEFELIEDIFRYLEYGAYQLELPMSKYMESVLEIEARKLKRSYCL